MKVPEKAMPVLAEISHINDLGKSGWYEVVYHDGENWSSYFGSDTFKDGERVLQWKYVELCLPKLEPGTTKAVGVDALVMTKIAEETARFCIQQLREEFLLNTQNYPREYHNMFYKKAKRVIDKINEKYGSNFLA